MPAAEKTASLFNHALIVGVGLIGSSLARAMRARDVVTHISGYDLSTDNIQQACDLGIVDGAVDSLDAVSDDIDLVIVATPVGATGGVISELSSSISADAIIMDVGSVKGNVVDAANVVEGKSVHVVPAHPVAGTENSGPAASFASLFEERWCIITPLTDQSAAYDDAVRKVEMLWQAVGSQVIRMDAKHHDLALAVTSHIPHLIAYTLVGAADDVESVNKAEIVKYSAGGFRDFTRIAASDPVMWRDVFLNNKDAVLEVLGRFSEELAVMQRAIRWGDAETLENAFARSRSLRKAIIEAGQDSPEPNFGRDRQE